ncbi:MAG: UDP-2,4-diacetamido-2,4,6-trideoxy-beta-L-altropyranose hydrolase [Caldilineaceae bacterium]
MQHNDACGAMQTAGMAARADISNQHALAGHPLVLRCDATTAIGSGHVMRCLALGQAWNLEGGQTFLVGHIESPSLRQRVVDAGIQYVPIEADSVSTSSPEYLKSLLNMLRDSDAFLSWSPWLVFDGYHFEQTDCIAAKQSGYRVLIIDDTAHMGFYDADILLNQNIGAENLYYNHAAETLLLLGTQYALLRQQFLGFSKAQREFPHKAHKLLVTLGGSDIRHQIPKILRALRRLQREQLEVQIILGHAASLTGEIQNELAELPKWLPAKIIYDARNMPELMNWADIAIAAGGSTNWELAYMGVPALLITIAENQLDIAQGLHEAEVAWYLGWYEDVDEEQIAERLEWLIDDVHERQRMSIRGQELVDGHGCSRVIDAILSTSKGVH